MNFSQRTTYLFVLLASIFLTNALLAELIGVKIFSLERSLGFGLMTWRIFGVEGEGLNLTAGVLLWPVVFIGTDIINEYYGKRGVRQISFLTAGLIVYAFVVIYLAMILVPADFWLALHSKDSHGGSFDIDFAFGRIFGQGLGIIVGSLVAFLLGQLLDVFVFQRLRQWTGSRFVWLRATGSTLVSQLVDSFVVLFIAFYLLAPLGLRWTWWQLVAVAIINYGYKAVISVVLTPLIYVSHACIEWYLGKDRARALARLAARRSTGFF